MYQGDQGDSSVLAHRSDKKHFTSGCLISASVSVPDNNLCYLWTDLYFQMPLKYKSLNHQTCFFFRVFFSPKRSFKLSQQQHHKNSKLKRKKFVYCPVMPTTNTNWCSLSTFSSSSFLLQSLPQKFCQFPHLKCVNYKHMCMVINAS